MSKHINVISMICLICYGNFAFFSAFRLVSFIFVRINIQYMHFLLHGENCSSKNTILQVFNFKFHNSFKIVYIFPVSPWSDATDSFCCFSFFIRSVTILRLTFGTVPFIIQSRIAQKENVGKVRKSVWENRRQSTRICRRRIQAAFCPMRISMVKWTLPS